MLEIFASYKILEGYLVRIFLIFNRKKGNTMSVFLRSLLVLSATSFLVVGCGEKEAAAPAVVAPAPEVKPVVPAAPATETAPSTGGGYEPTAEERVPGITLDAAAVEAAQAAAIASAEAASATK
jgi:hypothetical protein